MMLLFEDRESDSPLIERVWRSRSERAGTFLSIAEPHCELAVTRHRGRTWMTVRGPETRPTPCHCPADAEWIGIRLSIGTWLRPYPAPLVRDRRDVDLADVGRHSFRLENTTWEYPGFENAEVLVARLQRAGLLVRDPRVPAALAGDPAALSRRSAQRHFLLATGMTRQAYHQIQRARYAAGLLRGGMGIAEAVHQAGYFDQAHLTRSLGRLIGETPARIRRGERQLSFLYKTAFLAESMLPAMEPAR
jgi:AraC-like DNA-binding protein